MKKLLVILLITLPLLTWATDVQMDSLHCGDVVTITATPERGYRFVGWSDGNIDNPREIEITDAVMLTALYEPICQNDEVPVVWLYDQLMMVDVDSLQRMGYSISGQQVRWYRIVGDIDAITTTADDQLVATGFYYVLPPGESGAYYAVADVDRSASSKQPPCDDYLYSRTIHVDDTGLANATIQGLSLVPNCTQPGMPMQLMGLRASEEYTIHIYDAVGRQLEDFITQGQEQIPITAQRLPGYYMVCITNKDGQTVLRYVVKQ